MRPGRFFLVAFKILNVNVVIQNNSFWFEVFQASLIIFLCHLLSWAESKNKKNQTGLRISTKNKSKIYLLYKCYRLK